MNLWMYDWLVEQGLTSHSTQFRSFQRRCLYGSDDPTNSVKALKEGALASPAMGHWGTCPPRLPASYFGDHSLYRL